MNLRLARSIKLRLVPAGLLLFLLPPLLDDGRSRIGDATGVSTRSPEVELEPLRLARRSSRETLGAIGEHDGDGASASFSNSSTIFLILDSSTVSTDDERV